MRKAQACILLSFLAITLLAAAGRVVRLTNDPDSVGYEREVDWQLFFFAIAELPYLVVGLVTALALEHLYAQRKLAAER